MGDYKKKLIPLTSRYLPGFLISPREIGNDVRCDVDFVCGCGKPGCKECGDNPKSAGCELNCKLCNFDPDVAIPLVCEQRELLRKVLKDLWESVNYLVSNYKSYICEDNLRCLIELRALLLPCPSTRYYLDTDDEFGYPGFNADDRLFMP